MKYQTIEEIYQANEKIRANLKSTIENLSEEQATALPDGEKWSVAKIVEHLSMVEHGMTQIAAKLLRGAQQRGVKGNGEARISDEFLRQVAGVADKKVEAPEMVVPTGAAKLSESIEKLNANRKELNDLRPLFESVGCEGFTFPHPAFGQLNANEWLALLGGHEARHTAQIKRILEKM
ncbi:MAG: DinB family protein [Pyrinomonadaceae bacterium]|nr:DinB family protein [Pyrinomonadaceae bacterium]